jgi:hypothetical protein
MVAHRCMRIWLNSLKSPPGMWRLIREKTMKGFISPLGMKRRWLVVPLFNHDERQVTTWPEWLIP